MPNIVFGVKRGQFYVTGAKCTLCKSYDPKATLFAVADKEGNKIYACAKHQTQFTRWKEYKKAQEKD